MSRKMNQKLKLMYLAQIFMEQTDEEHMLTMHGILVALEAYEISAERKSIYEDIRELGKVGVQIEKRKKRKEYYYYMKNRDFELAELKLLVDAVQSSKFITSKKSNELIDKLKHLTSRYEANKLQRQVVVSNRAKSMNEEILENIDKIHMAINENRVISFQYYDWNPKKQMVLRHGGERYHVSPYALSWEDENYYLVGYDNVADEKRHYRVDRMLQLQILAQGRMGKNVFQEFNVATYSGQIFGMFGGKQEIVKLKFKNDFANVAVDRFDKGISMIPTGADSFRVNVKVFVSNQFLVWIFALGDSVEILGPEGVREKMREEIEAQRKKYLV